MKAAYVAGGSKLFDTKLDEIQRLYNEASGNRDNFQVNRPLSLGIVYIPGVEGGILFDRMMPDYSNVAVINLAAFPEPERGKGHLTQCMKLIDTMSPAFNFKIQGVYLNPCDNQAVWKRFGFVHEGALNLTMALFRKPMTEVFPDANISEGGIPMDDAFWKLLERYAEDRNPAEIKGTHHDD